MRLKVGKREILRNCVFCDVTKLQNAGLAMVRSQTDQIIFFPINGIVEQGLGHSFSNSTSSHFSNKTDFEQYLFNLSALCKKYLYLRQH